MPKPAITAFCIFSTAFLALLPAKAESPATVARDAAEAPTEQHPTSASAEEVGVGVAITFVERENLPGSEWPRQFAAKVLPSTEADALLNLMVASGHAKALEPQAAKLRPARSVWVDDTNLEVEDEATSGVEIMVGGVVQRFTTRNVGVRLGLQLRETRDGQVTIDAKVEQTRFDGFVEYGGKQVDITDQTTGKKTAVHVPTGFYQPIFTTTSRDETLTLELGQSAVVLADWPEPEPAPVETNSPTPTLDLIRPKPPEKPKPVLILIRLAPSA